MQVRFTGSVISATHWADHARHFLVKPGSLFPALHRMEEAGWLSSFWGDSENNRRAKFYRLTKVGKNQLDVETEQWETIALAMTNALKAT